MKHPAAQEQSEIDVEILAFTDYLKKHKGLAEKTIAYRGHYLHLFLKRMFPDGYVIHAELNAAVVCSYILSQLGIYTPQTVKGLISAPLRSYFRFLALRIVGATATKSEKP